MKSLLLCSATTLPSNYIIKSATVDLGIDPGSSCTPEEWAKAKRMESEYWDWQSYELCQLPKNEHPVYANMSADYKVYLEWEKILHKYEPLPRVP